MRLQALRAIDSTFSAAYEAVFTYGQLGNPRSTTAFWVPQPGICTAINPPR